MRKRSRLLGGEPRKASQRHSGRAAAAAQVKPAWRSGDKVRWRESYGTFLHAIDGEHARIVIADRVHRVYLTELR